MEIGMVSATSTLINSAENILTEIIMELSFLMHLFFQFRLLIDFDIFDKKLFEIIIWYG